MKLVFNDDSTKASLQYYGQKSQIPLKLVREVELLRNKNGPSLMQIEWGEWNGKAITGRYIMVSQGAVVSHFVYLKYNDLNVYPFDQDPHEW